MNRVTKLLAFALVLCVVFTLCACGKKADNPPATTTQPPVTTTEEPTPTTTVSDGKVTYTVTVQAEDGTPIVGAVVQLCKDVNCNPNVTGADGVATWSIAEDTYKVSFVMLPSGYTYSGSEENFYFAEGSRELTITLKAEG